MHALNQRMPIRRDKNKILFIMYCDNNKLLKDNKLLKAMKVHFMINRKKKMNIRKNDIAYNTILQ
jgi:hypothetical protein